MKKSRLRQPGVLMLKCAQRCFIAGSVFKNTSQYILIDVVEMHQPPHGLLVACHTAKSKQMRLCQTRVGIPAGKLVQPAGTRFELH